jgi:hypothetical protein
MNNRTKHYQSVGFVIAVIVAFGYLAFYGGARKTHNRGNIQKYFCEDCNRFFTYDDGFYRTRNKPEINTMSIDRLKLSL